MQVGMFYQCNHPNRAAQLEYLVNGWCSSSIRSPLLAQQVPNQNGRDDIMDLPIFQITKKITKFVVESKEYHIEKC